MNIPDDFIKVVKEQEATYPKVNFEDLKPGDIIVSNRFSNEEERKKIPKGHRSSPFIIYQEENGELLGFCGTSKKDKYDYNHAKYYNFDLDGCGNYSFFDLCHLYKISKKMYIRYIQSLSAEELKLISNKFHKYQNNEIEYMDVVLYKGKYYVVENDCTKEKRYTLRELIIGKHRECIIIGNDHYSKLGNFIKIVKSEPVKYFDSITEDKFLKLQINSNNIQPNSVIKYNELYYYVYKVIENKLYCYRLRKTKAKKYHVTLDCGNFLISENKDKVIDILSNFDVINNSIVVARKRIK